jgi:osmotically-inducible protein OsmY
MQRLLLFSLLLAFSAGAVAQTSQPPQATLATPAPASEPAVSSNGPVVLDYNTGYASGDPVEINIAKAVRRQLLMLPYYSMFDDLEYSVQGRTVTLSGAVTSVHSQTKRDAQNAVKHIEGVDQVVDKIQVLPPSLLDEQARAGVYRSLMRTAGLSQYFWQASPSIHIVVDHARVTLTGYVNSEGDKDLANIAAKEVRDVFQVTNNLQVVR